MNDCKFCQLLAGGNLASRLPNLLGETPAAVVALHRRPAAPGHVTIILKAHHAHTSELVDAHLAGIGDLAGRVSAALEKLHAPGRVVLLGDGKRSAHLHLHLIPEPAGEFLDLGGVTAALNQPPPLPPLLNDADTAAAVQTLKQLLGS